MKQIEWVRCPICGNKTRVRIREDTELKNFPLFCPKCKQECLIEAKGFHIAVLEGNYGIRLSPNTSYSLILPFSFYERYFAIDTWKNLEECTFFLHITGYPVEKDIQIQ